MMEKVNEGFPHLSSQIFVLCKVFIAVPMVCWPLVKIKS